MEMSIFNLTLKYIPEIKEDAFLPFGNLWQNSYPTETYKTRPNHIRVMTWSCDLKKGTTQKFNNFKIFLDFVNFMYI